ncbi:hypothetical protein CEXT_684321 [Caerostris extrusa]|uniref:Uncharacterized protein n=1 Tax=Caerostris extrusa TaxID=172846 RepID=A0AAV4XA53_CAEEX|nr:hypothetical protein CEXT_684321 [Caerostris extrusa]
MLAHLEKIQPFKHGHSKSGALLLRKTPAPLSDLFESHPELTPCFADDSSAGKCLRVCAPRNTIGREWGWKKNKSKGGWLSNATE